MAARISRSGSQIACCASTADSIDSPASGVPRSRRFTCP